MKLGMNHPMGPLTLADFIGLDTCLSIMEVLHKELGDSKYRPSVLLRQYVDTGFLGTYRDPGGGARSGHGSQPPHRRARPGARSGRPPNPRQKVGPRFLHLHVVSSGAL